MDKGKIAVQTAHGAIMYMKMINARCTDTDKLENFHDWCNETPNDEIGDMTKVVLRSNQKEMIDFIDHLMIKRIWAYPIRDKGHTQVDPDSLTCVVVEPLEDDVYNKLFGKMKLL